MSEGVSERSKRENEWAQQRAWAKQSGASKQVSGASERANGRASGPVLTFRFFFVPDHSAMVPPTPLPTPFLLFSVVFCKMNTGSSRSDCHFPSGTRHFLLFFLPFFFMTSRSFSCLSLFAMRFVQLLSIFCMDPSFAWIHLFVCPSVFLTPLIVYLENSLHYKHGL